MASFLIVGAHKQVSLFAGVSATVDSDYTDDWLCDGLPLRPIRSTNGNVSATVTPLAAGTVSLVASCHHNVSVNTVFGGDLSATVTAGALGKNGIYLNGYTTFAPVLSVDSFTVTVTSNPVTAILGEVVAGEYESLTLPFYRNHKFSASDFKRTADMDVGSIRNYDPGLVGRKWTAQWPVLSPSNFESLYACWEAQRADTRPTLVVPNTSVNDAWLCYIDEPEWSPADAPNKYQVSLTFTEIPRRRW